MGGASLVREVWWCVMWLGIVSGCHRNPMSAGLDVPVELPHTVQGSFDKDDRRWYFTGFVLNNTETTATVVPVVGLTDNLNTFVWVRQYVGVLTDSVRPGDYPSYPLWEAHGIRIDIKPGEQVQHLTRTDPLNTIQERPLYWYFWLASPAQMSVTKPHRIVL